MGYINLTEHEKQSIQAVDVDEMVRLLDKVIEEESGTALSQLPLRSCGDFVLTQLANFEQSLRNLRAAKSYAEREDAYFRARKDREALSNSVYRMKHRVLEDEKHAELFHVEDRFFHPPNVFERHLSIHVSYRWRPSKDDEWNYGGITFTHEVKPQISRFPQFQPKRRPSAAQMRRDLQRELYDTWERMKNSALVTIRDYFREGRDGSLIPDSFKAVPDSHEGYLNNNSLKFWMQN